MPDHAATQRHRRCPLFRTSHIPASWSGRPTGVLPCIRNIRNRTSRVGPSDTPRCSKRVLTSGISATIPAQLFLMDKWGRRPASIWGGLTMGGCMFTIGTLYATGGSKTSAGKWTIIGLIYVFIIAFSITWAIVIKVRKGVSKAVNLLTPLALSSSLSKSNRVGLEPSLLLYLTAPTGL